MNDADNKKQDQTTPSPGDVDYSNYGSRFARDEEGRRVDGDHRDLGTATPTKGPAPKGAPVPTKREPSSR